MENIMTGRNVRLNYMAVPALALLLGVLVGCSGSITVTATHSEQPAQAVYKTPEEVFSAAMAAGEKGDWKTVCGCITDESRDLMAAGLLLTTGFAEGFAKTEEDKAKFKSVHDVIAKHVPAPAQKAEKPKRTLEFGKTTAEDFEKAMLMAIAPIKDRNAFIVDMMAALKEMGSPLAGTSQMFQAKDIQLEGLKIQGDTATGFAVGKRDGQEERVQLEFKKVGEGWKIDFRPMLKHKR
jgi:hypothetical protein